VRKLILVLVMLTAAACDPMRHCNSPEEDASVEGVVTQGDLDEVGEDCDELCRDAYMAETGWHAVEVTECALDVTPQPGADPTTEVGTVTCEVHGIEYPCF
jgi:hypothetical protein